MLSTDLSARPTGGVLDVATGEFVARAALTVAGNYTIWARLGATAHVRGSPFHVLVTAAPFSAASSTSSRAVLILARMQGDETAHCWTERKHLSAEGESQR